MGNVLLPMAIVGLAAHALFLAFSRPDRQNPTLAEIQARHQAEEARRQAEQSANEARELAERIRQQADQDRQEARARQEEADKAAAEAARKADKLRAEMREAMNAANRAQELSEAARSAAKEEAAKLAQESQEEHERSRRMREEAERVMASMKEEAERVQQVADEQRRQAEVEKARAEELARTATDEMRKAIKAKEEAERRLKEGIQPIMIPTPAELAAAKRRIEYKEDCFHFALVGVSGSGKSSLVNAFRGLRSMNVGAAAVGVIETTLRMARYVDANPGSPFVWYDIPGAGTINCRDWQYFNDQGLYVFDCIIVLFDNRFTVTDIAILMDARRFDIPTYIVRSKADQHIRNIMLEMGFDEYEYDVGRRNKLYEEAQKKFIEETRKTVKTNLEDANLPDQRVYIVSNIAMCSIVQHKTAKKTIDEVDLVNDVLGEAYSRRGARSEDLIPSVEEGDDISA